MNVYLQFFVTIPFVILACQFYLWVLSLHGIARQNHCRALGVTYCTAGTVSLLFRSVPLALAGLILFMLGMRLIAYGLDRIDKRIYIDRFDEDR